MTAVSTKLRVRQRIGKFRIEKRLGEGGFATVYQAMDTIMGCRVALKVPHVALVDDELLATFRREVRLLEKIEHHCILQIKDASIIDDRLVISFPLGHETLSDRLTRRMSFESKVSLIEQLLGAVACAHEQHVIHCDIKPENVIMFEGGRIKLADFGIAKVARETIRACGTGTVGYMAPEQAMGRPSSRSDVFSLGLLFYRILSGEWPEWPFEWPMSGHSKLQGKYDAKMIAWLRKSIELQPNKRFADGAEMMAAFAKLLPGAVRFVQRQRKRRRSSPGTTSKPRGKTRRVA